MKFLMLAILLLSSVAHAKLFTFSHTLDDTGRNFNPGDYISMNMNSVDIQSVSMDCQGYRGSIATLYIDGVSYESKRLSTWRQMYTWNIPLVNGSNIEIRFSSVDPIVYSTSVTYESPVEIIVETQIEVVEVEVAKRNLYSVAVSVRDTLDQLYDILKFNSAYERFLDEALRLAEEVVYAGSNSDDSDASVVTQNAAIQLVDMLDCDSSRQILRTISKKDNGIKRIIRLIRTDLSMLREHLDYHIVKCSEPSSYQL